jgi:catechol 2,3-dioxygenase-like lactoylglutathione lyase family enzyme
MLARGSTRGPPRQPAEVEEVLMIKTEGLTHIHLLVSDLDRSVAFYQTVFGMEERFRDGPTLVFLRTPGSRDTITINQDPEQRDRIGTGGVDHFGFRLQSDADLDAAIGEVLAAGGTLVERGERGSGSEFAYVTDPDGYLIEL